MFDVIAGDQSIGLIEAHAVEAMRPHVCFAAIELQRSPGRSPDASQTRSDPPAGTTTYRRSAVRIVLPKRLTSKAALLREARNDFRPSSERAQ